MSTQWRMVTGASLLMLLLAAMSGPAAVRLLSQRGAVSGTWLVIALAADLVSVLSLVMLLGVGGYALHRLALVEVEE